MKLIPLLAVVTASFSTSVAAQAQRDLGSHEHGSATLNIALLDDSVIIELESPWNNLVGFEHQPSTDSQQAMIDEALASLNQPDTLFGFEGTECVATETVVENSLEHDEHDSDEHGHDDKHAEHDSDEHGHDDEHAEHDSDEHGHDHAEGSTHSSVFVSYSFNCDDATQLEAINVELFDIWSGFEELDVQLIGPAGQGATELGPEQSIVDIKQLL